MSNRCLYTATFAEFLNQEPLAVLGALHNNYHGDSLTTTDEAWMGEITLMQIARVLGVTTDDLLRLEEMEEESQWRRFE